MFWLVKLGSMGWVYLGYCVVVIDDEGCECVLGEIGEVVVYVCDCYGVFDLVFFFGYWNNEVVM